MPNFQNYLLYSGYKRTLYLTLGRSKLLYCSLLWRPHLTKDFLPLERVRQVTKFILNDNTMDYKTRLTQLNLLLIMYVLELQDILFLIKPLKASTINFNINNPAHFNNPNTRSSSSKSCHKYSDNVALSNSYFYRIQRLWNVSPIINLSFSFVIIKSKLYGITS